MIPLLIIFDALYFRLFRFRMILTLAIFTLPNIIFIIDYYFCFAIETFH